MRKAGRRVGLGMPGASEGNQATFCSLDDDHS